MDYDYSNETLYLETAPSYGDLAVNIALGITLVWLPLTFAAIGRVAFVKYRFTDKRISVISTAPWKQEQLDAAYQEVSGSFGKISTKRFAHRSAVWWRSVAVWVRGVTWWWS